jgi:hypothetical protein
MGVCDYRWGMDWILCLLTTLHTQLITTRDTAVSLIYTFYTHACARAHTHNTHAGSQSSLGLSWQQVLTQ